MLDINSFTTSDYNKFTSEILEMKTEEKDELINLMLLIS